MIGPSVEAAYNPSDQYWNQQDWANGAQGIRLKNAWDQSGDANGDSLGSDTILVAVIDDGFGMHTDLTGVWYTNPDEVVNGLDDDGTGCVDDIHGCDVWDGDGNPFWEEDDEVAHANYESLGTSVVGIIAAVQNSGQSSFIAGSANVKILPIRAHKEADVKWGIAYAWFIGADVVYIPSEVEIDTDPNAHAEYESQFRTTMARSFEAGALLVGPAGDGSNCHSVQYPMALPLVIAVGGVDDSGNHYSQTCDGNDLDLSAPAQEVRTLAWDGVGPLSYWEQISTSAAAAAQVVGTIALMMSYRHSLSPSQLWQILNGTALDTDDPLNGANGWDRYFGWGKLDAAAAMEAALRAKDFAYGSDTPPSSFGSTLGKVDAGPDKQPAIDVDPWGYLSAVWIGSRGVANQVASLAILDQTGAITPGSSPINLEANSVFPGLEQSPSTSPDVMVDTAGYSHIAWIDDPLLGGFGDIYYTRYRTDTQSLAVTKVNLQGAPGVLKNLNVLVEQGIPNPNVYFVYERVVNGVSEIALAAIPWQANWVQNVNAAAVQVANAAGNDEDPSADISSVSPLNECATPFCISISWENAGAIMWTIVSTGGAAPVGIKTLEGVGGVGSTRINPSLDVDPTTKNSAVAWFKQDQDSRVIRFSRVSAQGATRTNYPVTVGGADEADPSVSVDSAGDAGVVWSSPEPQVSFVEIGPWGAPLSRTPSSHGGTAVRVGRESATSALRFPQVAAGKPTAAPEPSFYDRFDGNFRFLWFYPSPIQIFPPILWIEYSSTRPVFYDAAAIDSSDGVSSAMDVEIGPDGSTHLVYTVWNSPYFELKYAYYPPGNSPITGGPAQGFPVVVCCADTDAYRPRVVLTDTEYDDEDGLDAHVLFIKAGTGTTADEVQIARFRPPNPTPIFGPDTFPSFEVSADRYVNALDADAFLDYEGTTTNPFPEVFGDHVPVVGGLWSVSEDGEADDVVFGSVTVEANSATYAVSTFSTVIQSTTTYGDFLTAISLAFGPADRVYFAWSAVDMTVNPLDYHGQMEMWHASADGDNGCAPSTGTTCIDERATLAVGNSPWEPKVRVDARLNQNDWHPDDFSHDYSYSSVHLAYIELAGGGTLPKYERYGDRTPSVSGSGSWETEIASVQVSPTVNPTDLFFMDFELTADNRPVFVYSYRLQIESYHQWIWGGATGNSQYYSCVVTGFPAARLNEGTVTPGHAASSFTEMPITVHGPVTAGFERCSTPELAVGADGTLAVFSEHTTLTLTDYLYQEAAPIPSE